MSDIQLDTTLSPTYVSLFGVRIPLVGLPGTVEQYRAAQSRMPAIKRDAPVTHFLTERVIRFAGDPAASAKSLFSTGLPFLLLLQLPLFAAWMRLMYFRQQRLYVEHLVFLLHTHTFFFLLIGCLFFADAAAQTFGARFPSTGRDVAEAILLLVIGAYNLLAYRRFYGQTWGKTLIKGWFLLQGYAFLLLFTSTVAAIVAFLYTLLTPG